MVWPAVVVMLTFLAMLPSGPFSDKEMTPPGGQAAGIAGGQAGCGDRRGLGLEDIVQAEELRKAGIAALRRRGGIVLHHDAVAAVGGNRKLAVGEAGAEPLAPSAVLSAVVKLPTVVPMLWAAPPSTDKVPGAEIHVDARHQIAAGIGDGDGGLAGEIQGVGRKQAGVAARQRGGRRIGGIGIGLGVEGRRRLLREIAQALGEAAQHLIAHVDHALERAAAPDAGPAPGAGRSGCRLRIDVLDRDVAVGAV